MSADRPPTFAIRHAKTAEKGRVPEQTMSVSKAVPEYAGRPQRLSDPAA